MLFLVDTNILIAMSKQRPERADRLEGIPADAVLLSSIVVAEIGYGIANSARRKHNRRVFDTLMSGCRVLPFDAAARLYGPIRTDLEKRGRLIDPNDLLIAAHARWIDEICHLFMPYHPPRVEGMPEADSRCIATW
jgi:tRNA(fMet)-specific endonuclease VapC